MSLLRTLSRSLTIVTLLASTALAQTCYYPDGKTVSSHVACSSSSGASSCCSPDAFCLDNGLCFGGGIVTRGSCTDKTWGSDACAGYCKTESPHGEIAISPCTNTSTNNTFVCGLNSTACESNSKVWTMPGGDSLVLRPSQIAALVTPTLEKDTTLSTSSAATVTITSCPSASANGLYTSGQMAGLGCGLAFPLGFALLGALYLLRKEKEKHSGPKLMYKLPDNHDEFTFRPPPPLHGANSNYSLSRPMTGSESIHSGTRTPDGGKPVHMQTFFERYDNLQKQVKSQERERHELDGTVLQPGVAQRHELAERMSK